MFFNLIQTQFLVLFAWALWMAMSRRAYRWAVVAGLLGAALSYTSYNLAVLAAMFALLAIVAFLLRPALATRALARKQILSRVWGYDYFGETRTVDVHVRQLRKKLPDIPIETVWGVGYRFGS